MNDEILEQIQSKIAFLESGAADLSDVVFRQHNEIQVLAAQIKALTARLSGAATDESVRTVDQERPPHY